MSGMGPVCGPDGALGPGTTPHCPVYWDWLLGAQHCPLLFPACWVWVPRAQLHSGGPRGLMPPPPAPPVAVMGSCRPHATSSQPPMLGLGTQDQCRPRLALCSGIRHLIWHVGPDVPHGSLDLALGEWCHCSPSAKFLGPLGVPWLG